MHYHYPDKIHTVFFEHSTTKMEVLAWTISSAGSGNDYTPNPRTVLKFPFNYLDTENDTWQKFGGTVEDVTLTYDGYGTLITPTHTYNNVVRIKEDYGGSDIDYQWYILDPLMAVAIFDHNNNLLYHFGVNQTTNIDELENDNNTFQVFPNPSNNFVTITNIPKASTISILDVTGKLVFSAENLNVQTTINTSNFTNGIYLIRLHNNKSIANKILTINR